MFNFGNQESINLEVPVEKLDLFIDRCITEEKHSLPTLYQCLLGYINTKYLSFEANDIYKLIIERVKERHNGGGK